MTVADVGAGTGLLTRPLQSLFSKVIAIEPNDEMRELIDGLKIKGTSEDTKLSDNSVNGIFAAQAFHWFDIGKTRKEFQRVLKAPYAVGLLWNDRCSSNQIGVQELDKLMKCLRGDGGQKLNADESAIMDFFQVSKLQGEEFSNPVELTRDSFNAMVLSRSYAPRSGTKEYEQLVANLSALFDKYADGDKFGIPYMTRVYWGFLRA
jgi:precorrin-6B methylase 2